MNVLFLSARFYPSRGGVQKHVYKVAQELIRKGHHVTVLTEKERHGGSSDLSSVAKFTIDNIDVVACGFGDWGFTKKFRIWSLLWSLREYFLKADIIHCHDVFFWYLPFRFLFPWIRVYTTFHGYEGAVPPRRRAVLIRRLSNFLSRGSIHIGSYIEKWYSTQADVTLYGGVDPVEQAEPMTRKGDLRILFVGRLQDDIGCSTYAKILDELTAKRVLYKLDICGDGSLRELFEKYGTVHGMVEDIDPFLRKADVVLASSYLTILEALSYKKPVVAVYENALKKDYLLDSPFAQWLIVGNDAEKLAEQVAEIAKSGYALPKQDELDHYLTTVTWEAVAHEYEELWKK